MGAFTRAAVVAAIAAALVLPANLANAGQSPVIKPVKACADLVRNFDIPGAPTHVTSTEVVPAAGTDPEYCDVKGHVDPAVEFELKLPTSTFTGRYFQDGCGGFCGTFFPSPFPDCGKPQAGDFAVAVTNDGHVGGGVFPAADGTWGANNEPLREDFFFRAPHVVSLASKWIITTYYGAPPKHSYFSGCSNGGREALLLAQRYPDDFDGIIAGAPAGYFDPLIVVQAWLYRSNTAADGSQIVTSDKLPALHSAVLAACDKLDGLVDGQLDDPRACTFDPGAIQCAGADQPTCLTAAQVAAVRKFYAGPTDQAGRKLYPAGEPRGTELAWDGWILPAPGLGSLAALLGDNYLKYLGYPVGTPASSLADFQFTLPDFNRLTLEGFKVNAMSLDLTRFQRHGGKLIIWHGWADQAIPPAGTVDYYQRLVQHSGGAQQTQKWARLFMIPGMYHCQGGDSLTTFDPTKELVNWVESGKAPEKVIAQAVDPNDNDKTVRTRPVFPYPLRAKYTGTGDINDAANFTPAAPLVPTTNDIVNWAGTYLHLLPGPVAH
ncbi:tannase/feruloyl esterase family alpha/beta hydrolase [Actinocrispum wychmicini]|uniref:Feruloyl esterase n=1 Tax=Actinocrispum wychmicini TaxID=1213861 RepID=A0A4R2JAI3_9PSEU|nr:tannase/feruloyl esterase family alpha/beta hydrolase [Actinocrispum wychmicini]TCO53668.1 feruloyl esterase [Actinocrispum wychmicini]